MTLIVETGAADPDAESYVSVTVFRDYCAKRGIELPDAADDDDKIEAAARTATEYADTLRRYKAARVSGEQGLQFPRTGLEDWDGHPVVGVPRRLINGVCYLMSVILVDEEPLYEVQGQTIAAEAIGPISTTYAPGSTAHREFTAFEKLVRAYWRCENDNMPAPGWSGDESDPTFTLGMQDADGGGYPGEY